ncbi:nicotinate-nucleotide adenylyltransferase [Caldimonas sp. KR1-144]|uniref:nicotinate-nucleotide adenylyltransferase n=1 Tax=Caldimonas sp. KR1-144 TaxID=3400911 RepID=UPI003C0F7643
MATASPSSPLRRIGVFGGTFDPPHMGHLVLARTAKDQLNLDGVLWIPAGQPWQKADRSMTEGEHRAAMVRAAITGHAGFSLDRRELQRSGPSYTIDTVRELQAEHRGAALYLIIGQDQYARLPTWHEWRELVSRVTLAVAGRDGQPASTPSALRGTWHRVEPLSMPPMDVSASRIREHIAGGGTAESLVPAMVPTVVARYIDRHHLYRAASPAA